MLLRLRLPRLDLVARGYFLLSDAYKKWRINPGARTEETKIAAFTCMAIVTIEPYRAWDPENAQTLAEARPNEIYALACASSIMGYSLELSMARLYKRLIDVVSRSQSVTLEPFVVNVSMEIPPPIVGYSLTFSKCDYMAADSLITIFELMSENFGGSHS